MNCDVLPHPPYSPDISPPRNHLYDLNISEVLKSNFDLNEDMLSLFIVNMFCVGGTSNYTEIDSLLHISKMVLVIISEMFISAVTFHENKLLFCGSIQKNEYLSSRC